MTMLSENANEMNVPLYRKNEFFTSLSAPALADFESLLHPTSYSASIVLFTETQPAEGIVVVIEGEVKLSINSSDGHRMSVHIARAGEVLGLPATLSGSGYEMTADTLYPARIAHVTRPAFLQFLTRHPDAYQTVAREMLRSYNLACKQLRMVGLSATVPERLARLLLGWSEPSQKSETSARCRLSLTHEEIGEFIGASRETVTRTLTNFKNRRLVAQHGCTLTIPSRDALESYAQA